MKILMLTSSFLPRIGGAEVGVHNLAEGLVETGQQVLICAAQTTQIRDHDHLYDLCRYTIPRGTFRLAIADWWVRRFLLKVATWWKPDVIHAHFTWPPGYAAIRARDSLHAPVVISPRGGDIQVREDINYGFRLKPALKKKIDAAVLQADSLVALSNNIRSELLKIGASAEHIVEIPNGFNYQIFSESDPGARTRLGFSPDQFIILAVGRNSIEKGFPDLIRATALLTHQNPGVICVIVGRNVQALSKLAREYGITESVRLYDEATPAGIEFKDQSSPPGTSIVPFYQAADVYAMPSLDEGLPMVGIEAMSAGLPLVATRTPGAMDLVQDGVNGLLTSIGNPDELASALCRLMLNPGLRQTMGSEARRIARRFGRQEIAVQHLTLYQRLTQNSNR